MISVPEESSALLLTQNHTLLRIDLVETDEEYFDDKCESRCAVLDADTFEVQHRTLYGDEGPFVFSVLRDRLLLQVLHAPLQPLAALSPIASL